MACMNKHSGPIYWLAVFLCCCVEAHTVTSQTDYYNTSEATFLKMGKSSLYDNW